MMVKEYFPSAGIGADIITGFPGESDEEFEKTMNFLRENPVTHFHPFPYSQRKNTLAAKMDCHVHPTAKKRRMQELISLGAAKLALFSEDQIGTTSDVLFERRNKQGLGRSIPQTLLKCSSIVHMTYLIKLLR